MVCSRQRRIQCCQQRTYQQLSTKVSQLASTAVASSLTARASRTAGTSQSQPQEQQPALRAAPPQQSEQLICKAEKLWRGQPQLNCARLQRMLALRKLAACASRTAGAHQCQPQEQQATLLAARSQPTRQLARTRALPHARGVLVATVPDCRACWRLQVLLLKPPLQLLLILVG